MVVQKLMFGEKLEFIVDIKVENTASTSKWLILITDFCGRQMLVFDFEEISSLNQGKGLPSGKRNPPRFGGRLNN